MIQRTSLLLLSLLLLSLLVLTPALGLAQEIPDNAVDEDGDGTLAMTAGPSIRASHPRVVIDAAGLQEAIDRMTGVLARDPYAHWFTVLKGAADAGQDVSFLGLALLYRATGQASYLDTFVARMPSTDPPGLDELYGADLIFDDLPPAAKAALMARAAGPDAFYWSSLSQSQSTDYDSDAWGYHRAFGSAPALAYAGLFALTPEELEKDQALAPFDAANYIRRADHQLSPDGYFYQVERRIAGDPTYNDALPGDLGGMYDNFGYDGAEESYSINLIAELATLKGELPSPAFYHDRYRGRFYQALQVPYQYTTYPTDGWCFAAGSEPHMLVNIWNTQMDYRTQPRSSATELTATLFQDPRMQFFANHGSQPELCGAPYDGIDMQLLFYDDLLLDDPPHTLPTASYFNGPGITVTRSDWSNDAAFGVLIAGEGISRRYEDANSIILGRRGHVVSHAGARIRFNFDNDKHHWYAIRSASKNTLKIFDPKESFDIEPDGTTGPLHSGAPLVASDNLGGQIFETTTSKSDGCFPTGPEGCSNGNVRGGDAFPLGVYERANTTKFEHRAGQLTYAVGDARAAYTRKIDLFEREFVHLLPNLFVVFDRVRSVDASYRKVWTVHTVDEPTSACALSSSGQGMQSYTNCHGLVIAGPSNVASVSAVWPVENRVIVRGGDTALVSEAPLTAGTPVVASSITQPEIGRWLEILGAGSDAEGSLLIEGDATEGADISETVTLTASRRQSEADGVPSEAVTATTLTDSSAAWRPGQWTHHMLSVSCGGFQQDVLIEANDATTLTASLTPCSAWRYEIYRTLANTTNHWQRLDRISTTDLDLAYLTVSTPHYFDTTDVNGRVISFAPHTDGIDDGYMKRKDLGQWTLEVEATLPVLLDNFLVTFALSDPGTKLPLVTRVGGDVVLGAVIGDQLVLFGKAEGVLGAFSAQVPVAEPLHLWLFDAAPDTDYGCTRDGALLTCEPGTTGVSGHSSSMGVVALDLPETVIPGQDGAANDEMGGCSCQESALNGSGVPLIALLLGLALVCRRTLRICR